MEFNRKPSTIMHIDLNSCFASIEQQANPFLRGKPLAVCAYDSPGGCILAASVDAKKYGVKTGMRVKDGKKLCPFLITMESDPEKYRDVHKKLKKLLLKYSFNTYPKSIDEFVLDFSDQEGINGAILKKKALEIKKEIKKEVGDYLTVSIGISTNRSLAKLASNLKKPDGLEEINYRNFEKVYSKIDLVDLHGINVRNKERLNSVGIYSVTDFYKTPLWKLKIAFSSINSYYWYLRLRGFEIDDFETKRRSFGNSYALPYSTGKKEELLPILFKLSEKTASRLRNSGFKARGINLSIVFRNGTYWHKSKMLKKEMFDTITIFKSMKDLLNLCELEMPVRILAESVFCLSPIDTFQLELFDDLEKKKRLSDAVDMVNNNLGISTVTFGTSLKLETKIHDRISFGGVREL